VLGTESIQNKSSMSLPPTFASIKAIFFDLDNTLLDHNAAERGAITALFATNPERFGLEGIALDAATFVPAYSRVNEQLWYDMAFGRIAPHDLKRERFAQTLAELYPHLPTKTAHDAGESMGRLYLEQYRLHWSLLPHAHEVVQHISSLPHTQGLKRPVGIISNGFTDQQRGKLAHFGWETQFAPVLLSGEIGVMKPHKAIFDAALEAASALRSEHPPVQAQEALYIGDSYAHDIEGAAQAGWRTIWLNARNHSRTENRADLTITSLEELFHVQFQ
jgi:HAD superfamily hydrolase (TIGR01549 family)